MSDSLRRRTLVQNAIDSSLPIRTNDDEERAERRIFSDSQRLSPSSFNLSSGTNVDGEQAKQTLQTYKKLMDKNKIDVNMAWKMRVTELIGVLNKSKIDDFHVAASSIEIAAKVYEMKVDDFHSDVMKCLSSVNKTTSKEKNEDENNDPGDDLDRSETSQKKQTKKAPKKVKKSCIMDDPSKCLGELPMLEPVTILDNNDVSSSLVDNFLTSRLPMDGASSMFTIFEKDCKAFPMGNTDKLLEEIGDGETEFDVSALPSSGMLCSAFKDFQLEETYATNIALCETEANLAYELDDSPVNDPCSDNDDDHQEYRDPLVEQQIQEFGVEHGVDIMSASANYALGTSTFSFNPLVELSDGTFVQRLWTGPHFWKFKHVISRKAFYTGRKDTSKDGRKRGGKKVKEQKTVDFMSLADTDDTSKIVQKKVKRHNRTASNQIKKVANPKIDLGHEDFFKQILSLMLKPSLNVKSMPVTTSDTKTGDVDVFEDFDNDCDNPFDNIDEVHEDDERVEQRIQSDPPYLVEAPEYVPIVEIAYDRTAKKMNIQKLCALSWQLLKRLGNAIELPEEDKIVFSPVMFSKFFRELPNVLPTDMRAALSFHLSFAAMLQLCNDKSLCLKNVRHNEIVILCEDPEENVKENA